MTLTPPDTHPVNRLIGNTDLAVHPIGLDGSIFGWAAGPDDTAEVLDVYRSGGGNFVSTADHYAGGRSEVMIGTWLRSRGLRDEIVVATKVGRHPDNPGLHPRALHAAVDASLERLGIDCIDLVSFDGESADVPIDDSLGAMADLIDAGKVRAIGASGFGKKALAGCDDAAQRGLPEVNAFVAEYNLLARDDYEKHIKEYAMRHGRSGLARLPLASGFLTGDFREKEDFPTEGMFMQAASYAGRKATKVLAVLDEIAAELGQTPGRVAVAWVICRPGIASAIARARSSEQVADFLQASMLDLPRECVARLDRVSA